MNRKIQAIIPAVGMLILILDTQSAVQGAAAGVQLCIRTLIPSLFPFIFLSVLLTSTVLGTNTPVLRWIGRLCHLKNGTEPLLVVGLMGGYPVGAQNIGVFYRSGSLDKPQAERMLAFCSNAGPAFLFGIVGPMFSKPGYVWLLWGIHIAGALLVGNLFPADISGCTSLKPTRVQASDALSMAIKAMASICGWVVLFRILLYFLERWALWILPVPIRVTIAGILELANGCVQLCQIPQESTRFLIASILLALGGLCVVLQTASVTQGLSIRPYIAGKLLHALFSGLLADMIRRVILSMNQVQIPAVIDAALIAAIVAGIKYLTGREKRSSIPSVVGV